MELLENLNWRYAAKRMTGETIPAAKIDSILDAIRLSASSFGLQPYTVLVIENEDLRKQIQPLAFNQPQITEASHLLVFAAWDHITAERLADFINLLSTVKKADAKTLAYMKTTLEGFAGRPGDTNFNWAARQAYIAIGTALIAAAEVQVDATPMEGFDPLAVDEILGLKEKGLRSVALVALGYRDTVNDWSVKAPKMRREKEKLFISLN